MVHCCVPGCKNTHHHKTKKEEWQIDSRNYSLHDLPGEDRIEVRDLWVMAINRSTLPKDVAVCSDHFTEDCFDEKWEEYKRKYGPTKVKRKLKLDAVPTIFPGRVFYHEKVHQIREDWKNKVLQKRLEYERLRLEKEYRDRFKATQTECQCKCRCKLRKKNFGQQVNFQFKFMEDVGVQFPKDLTEAVKVDHSYTQGGKKKNKCNTTTTVVTVPTYSLSNNSVSIQTSDLEDIPTDANLVSDSDVATSTFHPRSEVSDNVHATISVLPNGQLIAETPDGQVASGHLRSGAASGSLTATLSVLPSDHLIAGPSNFHAGSGVSHSVTATISVLPSGQLVAGTTGVHLVPEESGSVISTISTGTINSAVSDDVCGEITNAQNIDFVCVPSASSANVLHQGVQQFDEQLNATTMVLQGKRKPAEQDTFQSYQEKRLRFPDDDVLGIKPDPT